MAESLAGGNSVSYEKMKRVFKIIVIGDTNVGKTCLTFRFCGGEFPLSTEATIGVDFREKEVVLDNEHIKLQIWDTAGQERFRKSMIPHYYRNIHAVIFVYDMTKINSFRNLSNWIDECNRCHEGDFEDIPRIIVGNKCDCLDRIAVSTNMAQKFADEYNMPLFETSAKDNSQANHIDAIFMTIAHKLKNHKTMMLTSDPTIKIDRKSYASSPQVKNEDSWCFCF